MSIYQTATPYSDPIVRRFAGPSCPKCGTKMMLAIEPDKPGHDKRTFECPECQHCEIGIVKYR